MRLVLFTLKQEGCLWYRRFREGNSVPKHPAHSLEFQRDSKAALFVASTCRASNASLALAVTVAWTVP